MATCDELKQLYDAYLAKGDIVNAMAKKKEAVAQGCDWALGVGFHWAHGEPSFHLRAPMMPDITGWPPCPTPWGPGPKFSGAYVSDPVQGVVVPDP
jgi:hypothetical protein